MGAFPWEAVLGAAPSILHLFGVGGGDNGASQYRQQQQADLGQLGRSASDFGTLGQQALGSFNNYDPQYRQSVNNYYQYLQQNPATDQADTAYLNRATQGTTAAYQAAKARLAEEAQQTGMMTPDSGGAASTYTGALAGIESALAQQQAQAQNDLANYRLQQHQQNLAQSASLMGDVSQNYYNRGIGALNTQDSLYSGMADQYGRMADFAQQQANLENQQSMSGLENFGGLLGKGLEQMARK